MIHKVEMGGGLVRYRLRALPDKPYGSKPGTSHQAFTKASS